jgi:hypothetical protein
VDGNRHPLFLLNRSLWFSCHFLEMRGMANIAFLKCGSSMTRLPFFSLDSLSQFPCQFPKMGHVTDIIISWARKGNKVAFDIAIDEILFAAQKLLQNPTVKTTV